MQATPPDRWRRPPRPQWCCRPVLARVALPRDLRCAFEFRHASWLTESVYDVLKKFGIALCLAESEKLVIPEVVTAGFVYSRLRMPEYSAEDRKEIAARGTVPCRRSPVAWRQQ